MYKYSLYILNKKITPFLRGRTACRRLISRERFSTLSVGGGRFRRLSRRLDFGERIPAGCIDAGHSAGVEALPLGLPSAVYLLSPDHKRRPGLLWEDGALPFRLGTGIFVSSRIPCAHGGQASTGWGLSLFVSLYYHKVFVLSTLFLFFFDFFGLDQRLCNSVGLALSRLQVSRLSATRLALGAGLSSLCVFILAPTRLFVNTFLKIFCRFLFPSTDKLGVLLSGGAELRAGP